MHRIWAGALAAGLALMLALAGCGGDDPLTRAELTRQAGAICERVNRQTLDALSDAQENLGEGETIEDSGPAYEALVSKVADLQETGNDELDELAPPEEMADTYDDFVTARRQVTELLPEANGDDPDAEARSKQETAARKAAEKLKIRGC